MNVELLLRALFKFMGVNEHQMRETFDKGQALIVDGSQRIADIDARLERIERALNIPPETPARKELTHGDRS